MPDPKTEELQLAEVQRELTERRQAREAEQEREEEAHERRAEKHAYLREKLAERAQSEDEVASEDAGG
jgi:septal ring factor EnvC (AmiA/AmiB activator)